MKKSHVAGFLKAIYLFKQIQLTIMCENDNGVKKSHTHTEFTSAFVNGCIPRVDPQHVTRIISLVPLSNTYFSGDKTKTQWSLVASSQSSGLGFKVINNLWATLSTLTTQNFLVQELGCRQVTAWNQQFGNTFFNLKFIWWGINNVLGIVEHKKLRMGSVSMVVPVLRWPSVKSAPWWTETGYTENRV